MEIKTIEDVRNSNLFGNSNYNYIMEESMKALAIAIYACIKYQEDFEKAIVCAVNHGGDSDSTGAIAGNIVWTYLGIEKYQNIISKI